MTYLTFSPATFQALTIFFTVSSLLGLFVGLLAALRHAYCALRESNLLNILSALRLAWFFAFLAAVCFVAFAYALASTNILDLLSLSGEVVFSCALFFFVFGALNLLPVVMLALEAAPNQANTSA